jgi:hypothetical protein
MMQVRQLRHAGDILGAWRFRCAALCSAERRKLRFFWILASSTAPNRSKTQEAHMTAQYKRKFVYIEHYVGVIYRPPRPPIYEFYG